MATINRRSSRKSLALALAIVGVAGLSMASAAQLTVNTSNIAAGVGVVGACDTSGVTVTYPDPLYTSAGYTVNSVTISDIDAGCAGMDVLVTLTNIAGASIGSGSSLSWASGDVTINFSPAVKVADITGVAVAIG